MITIQTPAAQAVAEELAQLLLAKHLVDSGFSLTALDTYAFLEFPEVSNGSISSIESEIQSWINRKHGGLRKRRVNGRRQKQILGTPMDMATDIVCIEIRK